MTESVPAKIKMSKARIESFSDGVFSIVLTLLVFNFQVPKLSGPNFDHELYRKLVAMYPYLITYVLSFVLISMYWVAHHNMFHHLKYANNWLLGLNSLFLLFLALTPFPTQVLGAYPTTESAAIFFGLAMVCTSLSFSLLRYYAFFRGRLQEDFVNREAMRNGLTKNIVGAVLYIVAISISAYSENITLSMYALIPFLFFVPLNIKRKGKKT